MKFPIFKLKKKQLEVIRTTNIVVATSQSDLNTAKLGKEIRNLSMIGKNIYIWLREIAYI